MYGDTKAIQRLTGVTPQLLQCKDDDELDKVLKGWLEDVTAAIDARLKRTVKPDDDDFKAISDIAVRTVAKIISYAKQVRKEQIVKYEGETLEEALNTTKFYKDLRQELRPYMKNHVTVFTSAGDDRG